MGDDNVSRERPLSNKDEGVQKNALPLMDGVRQEPKTKGREIRTINYGRGLAALGVVLYHEEGVTVRSFGQPGAGGWFFGGHSGVEYFFVLSGLIIFSVHYVDVGRSDRLRTYISKRLIRIFPMFWFVVIPLGLAFLLNKNLGVDRDLTAPKLILDVFLLPRDGRLTLPPAWTLQEELVFYAVFATLIMSRKAGMVLFALWQSACLLTLSFDLIPVGFQNLQPAARFVGHENFGFLAGFAIVALDRRIGLAGRRSAQLVGCFGLILLALILVIEGAHAFVVVHDAAGEAITYFVIFSCIIIGLLAVPNVPRPILDRTLGELGKASYVLYLIHEPVGSVTVALLENPSIRPLMNAHLAYAICVAVAVASSICVHYSIEAPLLGLFKGQLTTGRR